MRYMSKAWREDKIGFLFDVTWLVQIQTDDMGWVLHSSHSTLYCAKDAVVDKLKDWKRQNYQDFTPADIRLVKMEKGMYD